METNADRLLGGRYRLDEVTSTTRRGETWFGRDERGNKVVVSFVYPVEAPRFLKNMAAAATVRHPGVAPVVDYGVEGAASYVVTERIEGTDLAALMASPDPLPPETVAQYGEAAAAGLVALHGSGLVHGHVRPKNLVRTDDSVCLIGAAYSDAMPPWFPSFGVPPGEAYFLSPEQAEGFAPVPASDIYALGATLYQLATGRPPFDGASAGAVARSNIVDHVVPPRSIDHRIPLSLEGIILKALAKDPEQRFHSAEEMRTALAGVTASPDDDSEIVAAATLTPRTRRLRRLSETRTVRRSWWRKDAVWSTVVIVTSVVLGALAAVLATGALASGTLVPDLRGMTLRQAEHVLSVTGLSLGEVTADQGVDPNGTNAWVISQTPKAGRDAKQGARIDLRLGATHHTVPDLTGFTEAEARARAGAAGFRIGQVTRVRRPGAPDGTVVTQTPAAGAPLQNGGTIDLVIASASASGVPDVVGDTEAEAVQALQRAGYTALVQHASNSAPKGTVISQYPQAGQRADRGSPVTIVVSDGSTVPSQGQGQGTI